MTVFTIQPHGRLQEWVAREKGYFEKEELEYRFIEVSEQEQAKLESSNASQQILHGAYQYYEQGHSANISCACHWTVNMAASAGHGSIWPHAYSVTPGAIFVALDSDIYTPDQLANVPVTVGYQSGSHYASIQALEPFLKPEEINLQFAGLPANRLDAIIDGNCSATAVFGVGYYLLEQLGFRKVVDATFMIASMITNGSNIEDVLKYYRALKLAQQDIDLRHQQYTHYYKRALPLRFHDKVDTRTWGPGERIVFLPYSQQLFEETQKWILERNIFESNSAELENYDSSIVADTR